MNLLFTWDPRKAASNLAKHRVAFDEAVSVFRDRLARIFSDEEHSESEARELIIGHSSIGRLLVVSFTEEREGVVRVISARLTTPRERRRHEEAV